MKLFIEAEPKELLELCGKESRQADTSTEMEFEFLGGDWNKQQEFIKKISAEYSGNCNLRIVAKN